LTAKFGWFATFGGNCLRKNVSRHSQRHNQRHNQRHSQPNSQPHNQRYNQRHRYRPQAILYFQSDIFPSQWLIHAGQFPTNNSIVRPEALSITLFTELYRAFQTELLTNVQNSA
jgi:hypothetical protein